MKTTEQRYKLLTEREKILLRPSRYLGDIATKKVDRYIVDDSNNGYSKQVQYNPALLKMFDEIISNSVDASTRKELKHLNTVKVTVTKTGGISVSDNGGIPVEIHKEHNVYVPELIFGNLHCGENFDDDSDNVATGSNGEGSSLVNIFSKAFKVVSADGKHEFQKIWKNNMVDSIDATIKKSSKKGTTISFFPDTDKLGNGVNDLDNYLMIKHRTTEIAACNPHLNVYFNDVQIKFNSFEDYVKLYNSKDEYVYTSNKDWNVAIAPSETGTLEHLSFVNSTNTYTGGTHVQYIADQLIDDIRQVVKKKYKFDVKPAEIKNHLRLFINCTVVNPRYNSQTKEDLVTPSKNYSTAIKIPDNIIKKVINGNVLQRLIDWLEAKKIAADKREAKKNDKAAKRTKVSAHLPANSNNINERILFITEGQSAISNLINVRNPKIHGGYPLKGKFKNTIDVSGAELMSKDKKGNFKYKEVAELMSIVGLNSDGTYNLNYGVIGIMADADEDGNCIVGLLLNFFSKWPKLFEEKRIKILTTPVVIAKNKNFVKRFYTYNEYKDFKSDEKYSIEYLKGLGSLSEDEYDRAINKPRFIDVDYTAKCKETLELVFMDSSKKNPKTNIKYSDERKLWLSE